MTKKLSEEEKLEQECLQIDIGMAAYQRRLKTDEKERERFIKAMRALGMNDEEIAQRLE